MRIFMHYTCPKIAVVHRAKTEINILHVREYAPRKLSHILGAHVRKISEMEPPQARMLTHLGTEDGHGNTTEEDGSAKLETSGGGGELWGRSRVRSAGAGGTRTSHKDG
jgi:hypothetical protein